MSSYYGEKHRIEADRARQDERARIERLDASAVRDRLEKQSGRGEGRSNLGFLLGQMSATDTAARDDVSGVLDGLRKAAQRAGGSDGAGDRNSTMRAPNYEQGGVRSRFDHDEAASFAPTLNAGNVRDLDGQITGDARTERDHFGTGDVSDAMDVLTAEDFAAMMRRRWRGRYF